MKIACSFSLLLLMISGLLTAADSPTTVPATRPTTGPTVQYLLLLSGKKPDGWEKPDAVSASTSDDGGYGVVFVNGDPVDFYKGGQMSIMPVNEWLVNGKNTVWLAGHFTSPIYVTVARTPWEAGKAGKPQALGRKAFDLTGHHPDRPVGILEFNVRLELKLPDLAELHVDENDLHAIDHGPVKDLLRNIESRLKQHDGKVIDDLTKGRRLWEEPAYGEPITADELDPIKKLVTDPTHELDESANSNNLHLIYGRRVILCYRNDIDEGPFAPFLFRYKPVKEEGKPVTRMIPPLRLAIVNRELIVWK